MAAWEDELGALVRARGAALVGYAYLLCGDRREAEDLVQDALVRTFTRGRRLSATPGGTVTNLEGYVRRAVLTTYLDGFRRRRRWAALRHLAVEPEVVAPHDDAAIDREDVAVALRGLPHRERTCVVLRFYEDWTVAQIADALSVSQGSVKRYLSDGVHRMEDVLGLLPQSRAELDGEDLAVDVRRTR
jgi:RNA polymerase sigma-70 factor (ECF subfamily)